LALQILGGLSLFEIFTAFPWGAYVIAFILALFFGLFQWIYFHFQFRRAWSWPWVQVLVYLLTVFLFTRVLENRLYLLARNFPGIVVAGQLFAHKVSRLLLTVFSVFL
jgi:hypothetical protein